MEELTPEWITLTKSFFGHKQVTTEAMNTGTCVIVKNTTVYTGTSDPVCMSESMVVVPNMNVEEYNGVVLWKPTSGIEPM